MKPVFRIELLLPDHPEWLTDDTVTWDSLTEATEVFDDLLVGPGQLAGKRLKQDGVVILAEWSGASIPATLARPAGKRAA